MMNGKLSETEKKLSETIKKTIRNGGENIPWTEVSKTLRKKEWNWHGIRLDPLLLFPFKTRYQKSSYYVECFYLVSLQFY